MMQFPQSCDTFVVLPPYTRDGEVIFGKNSDRPQNEVQEVIYVKGAPSKSMLHCTYISVEDDVNMQLNSVILSKPAWTWGAEMGANDKNVVIGNEAVWTRHNYSDGDARTLRLLGMDLVRIGLERGNTAEEALDVIAGFLEKHGQGGPCSEHDESLIYHNSFLIADPKSAWVMETSGSMWAAEKLETGYRNISNGLTITTKIDKSSVNLQERAQRLGYWDGEGVFDFTKCFSSGGDELRQIEGEKLLKNYSASMAFDVTDMFRVLRHKDSRICRACDDSFPTQGSQVSSLTEQGVSVHWFTATPDPSMSFFKPFVFTNAARTSLCTVSPSDVDSREHELYKLHAKFCANAVNMEKVKILYEVENVCLTELNVMINKINQGDLPRDSLGSLMEGCVETEMEFYEQN